MEAQSTAAKIQSNLQELFKAKSTPGNSYIRFQLDREFSALLSMARVQESLLIDARQIAPLPGMPPSTIGITSRRDRVFCVFDLAQVLGITSTLAAPRQYQVIVLQASEEDSGYIGLAVHRFLGMARLTTKQIASSVDVSFAPFVSGATQEEPVPILDLNLIIEAIAN